ncbi:MAG: hypothetical protein K2Q25_02410 [Mycobacteriaceae bacterium]|nr:hypothetical protein [Mycobacteriaceae bacterium]
MGLLNPAYAPLIAWERPTEDADGNTSYADLGTTATVVSLASPRVEAGSGPRFIQSGTVFVPRGIDRKAGDRFTYKGFKYTLVGVARGDQDHPFTGADLGWMALEFQGGETRWT